MPTPPDPFDEFLRQIASLMQSPPLYQSLELACVAAKHGSEWILISGKAVLNAEPYVSEAQIVPAVQLQEIIALQGRIPAEGVNDLVANLRDSWVVRGLKGIDVRLTAEGAGGYSWTLPAVSSVDKSWNPSSRWSRGFALYGNGPDPSSILSYSTLREIDSQLRKSTPAYNGFDGLCDKLGLPLRQSNLTSSFQVSAELPARVLFVNLDRYNWALLIAIDCLGEPDLMVDWFPQPGLERVPPGWYRGPNHYGHGGPLAIPADATTADLILSFGEHQADVSRVEIPPDIPGDEVGVPDRIPLEVVHKEPTVPDLATRNASNLEYGRWQPTGKVFDEGGQGYVSIVEDTQEEYRGLLALKKLRKFEDSEARERFEREVKVLRSINHSNIVSIKYSDPTAKEPYFVAEYCEGGSLQTIGASRFKGDILATMRVALPIVDAIVAAHQANPGVIHRDIKPANILFRKDGTPVVGDFGICSIEDSQGLTSLGVAVGARHFIAPEMESGGRGLGPPTNRTDMYSVGKLLYWMLSGGLYLDRERHRDNSLVKLLNDQRWEHMHSLFDNMIVERPEGRLQSTQLKDQLQMAASLVEGNFAPVAYPFRSRRHKM